MKITGKNFLIALLIAFIITVILTVVYLCAAFLLNLNTTQEFNVSVIVTYLTQGFVTVGVCFAPIVFLLSFALLQRFRIKDNLEKDTDEEDKMQNLENL